MTPVANLRAAAAKLRETAKPFLAYFVDHPITGTWYEPGQLAEVLAIHVGTPNATADEDWIALMSPALAEPLAAWLEHVAEVWGFCKRSEREHALAVARVINGGAS